MTALYHYTCQHGRDAIGDEGMLMPMRDHAPEQAASVRADWRWLTEVVWLTDMAEPIPREALGLTSLAIACDRSAYRYRAYPDNAERFTDWTRRVTDAATRRHILEGLVYAEPGARPAHWFISATPVPVRIAP